MQHPTILAENIVPDTAPMPVTYPPANLSYFCDHPWPVPAPCEPGIYLECVSCGAKFAPCTRSALDLERVTSRTWRCRACGSGGEA